MKSIFVFFICFAFGNAVFAQKVLPEIKEGTTMQCLGYVQGQEFPLSFTVKGLKGPLSLAWSVAGYGDGAFVMSAKALEGATKMYMTSQPATGDTKLADDETFGLISKAAFKSLMDNKSFTYSGIKFKIKTSGVTPFSIGGKEIDAIPVVSEDGKLEFSILNNPNLPLILQSSGMPTDMVVTEIK